MDHDQQDVLSAIGREIAERIGPKRFELWFRPHATFCLDSDALLVEVPNHFLQEWLSRHFQAAISEAAASVTGRNLDVRFRVCSRDNGRSDHAADTPNEPAAPTTSELVKGNGRTPSPPRWPSLDEFVVGGCNRLAYAAALQASQASPPWPCLLVHGTVGLGKTHLLQGIGRSLLQTQRQRRVVYLSSEQFTNEFVTALRGGGLPSFRQRYRRLDVLVVDDLQFLSAKRATQEEFLHTFDSLTHQGRMVVLACDREPRSLTQFSEELLTRLQAGMVCRLDPPDFATRVAILKAKAAQANQAFPEEVVCAVAEHLTGNVRQLEGALHRLRAYRELLGQTLDRTKALEALTDLMRPAVQTIRLEDVQQAVCEVFGIEPKLLRSPVRQRHVSYPRMLAMYLARKHTRAAYSQIGHFFGGRNHSTVISAEKKVAQWLQRRETFPMGHSRWNITDALNTLERQLRAG